MNLRYISFIVVLVALISCSKKPNGNVLLQNTTDSSEFVDENILVAFEGEGIEGDIKSYSRLNKYSNNPIDKMFRDYLETDEQLENDIELFKSLSKEGNEKSDEIGAFITNNDQYYLAVETLLNSIKETDTIVHKLVFAKIEASKANYSKQREYYSQLIKNESDVFESWNAYLSVIKILKTLEMVEKYQKVETVDEESFKELMDNQKELTEKLIQRID